MKAEAKGWVVLTYNHGYTGNAFMVASTFARTRKESIELFTEDSEYNWEHLCRKYNYRCVKAESIIIAI